MSEELRAPALLHSSRPTLFDFCAFWLLRFLASAVLGFCAVCALRRLGPALFGPCAVCALRRSCPAPFVPCARLSSMFRRLPQNLFAGEFEPVKVSVD